MDSGRVGVTQVWSRNIGPQGCLLGGHQEAFLGALQCSGNIKVSGVVYSWQIVAKNTITEIFQVTRHYISRYRPLSEDNIRSMENIYAEDSLPNI